MSQSIASTQFDAALAALRKQWQQELLEKFSLPCPILDETKARKAGIAALPQGFSDG